MKCPGEKGLLFSLLGGLFVSEKCEGLGCFWRKRGGLSCLLALGSSLQPPGSWRESPGKGQN